MWNARLDESQTEIKISKRNINNLRYAYYTTLMAESKKELKSLFMRVKEERGKPSLKLNIQKMKIMASGIEGKSGSSDSFYFLRLQNHCRW